MHLWVTQSGASVSVLFNLHHPLSMSCTGPEKTAVSPLFAWLVISAKTQ